MSVVVDAGVVCKLLFPESGSDAAQALVASTTLAAPDLIYPEVGNVVWKRARFGALSQEEAHRAMAEFVRIPLFIADSRVLLPHALEIALTFNRTVYDSLYLALAMARDEDLVTTDARLVNGMAGSPWAPRLRFIC